MDGKCLNTIECAVVMIRASVEEFVPSQNRRFRWEAFLPKWKAWIQTLILLPFGLSVANFLGASWHFSVNSIVEEGQHLVGVLSMVINLLVPSLFFAFLLHWSRLLIGKEQSSTWYPKTQGLWAGAYATFTIAISFGVVGLFTHSLGICGNPAWGSVAESLLCNLDGYGLESKSWFGAWFIIAAYCYQAQISLHLFQSRNDPPRFLVPTAQPKDPSDFTAVTTVHEDYLTNPTIDPTTNNGED